MNNRAYSILLVEDEENLHEALKLNLQMEDYEVSSAYTGTEALAIIKKEYFDLVILDIMLPEVDGLTVCEFGFIKTKHPF
jgi:two-component system alkaline phosphatase synthesis response regulator PhoP